jgi:multidrug transporter EmrE-like cation transporter
MTKYIPLILSGVLLNAAAQLFLKKGMTSLGEFAFSVAETAPALMRAAFNPYIIAGLASYAVSVLIWMLVLSRAEVSFAYPFLSVGYIVTAVAGYMLFGENLSGVRIGGIALICLGVVLISRSA